MKYIIVVMRGIVVGCLVFGFDLALGFLSISFFYPQFIDTIYVPSLEGGFSKSSNIRDQKMPEVMLYSVIIGTALFIAFYLYLRRRFYLKHPEYK